MDSEKPSGENGSMNAGMEYLEKCRGLIETIRAQEEAIAKAADIFSGSILAFVSLIVCQWVSSDSSSQEGVLRTQIGRECH